MLDACAEGLGSALHIAATQTPPRTCLEILLDSDANFNAMCKDIGSPLHSAVRSGSYYATCSLLERGANVNALCGQFGNVLDYVVQDCFSGLLDALDGQASAEDLIKLDIIRVLLEYGANAQNQGINTALRDVQHGKLSSRLNGLRLFMEAL
jgi:ankyrin repeat protein